MKIFFNRQSSSRKAQTFAQYAGAASVVVIVMAAVGPMIKIVTQGMIYTVVKEIGIPGQEQERGGSVDSSVTTTKYDTTTINDAHGSASVAFDDSTDTHSYAVSSFKSGE